MTTQLLEIALTVAIVIPSTTQGNSNPDVPDKIKAPAGEQVVLKAHASGSQIYECRQGDGGKFAWTLKAPEAELRDDQGRVIGHHYTGPAWKHNDGSEVTGKPVARVEAPNPEAIPWLLVNVVSHSGSGVLAAVTTIQRINTKGGQPPPAAECVVGKQDAEAKIAYTADYYFYAPAK